MIRVLLFLGALLSPSFAIAGNYTLSHAHENGAPRHIKQMSGPEMRVIAGEEYSLVVKNHPASNFHAWVNNFTGSTIISTIQSGVALGKTVHVQAACFNERITFKYFKFGNSEITTDCKVINAYYD